MGVKIFFFNGTSMKKMIVNFVKPLRGWRMIFIEVIYMQPLTRL